MSSTITISKVSIIFFLILLVPLSAFSEPESDTMMSNRAAIAEFKEADDELNLVWGKVIPSIKDSGDQEIDVDQWLKQAQTTQRAWLKFRDESMKIFDYYCPRGCSGKFSETLHYKTRLTKERTKQLRDIYYIKD